MTRLQLEHVIRAAAATANVNEIVVIGSQSILGAHPDAREKDLHFVAALIKHRFATSEVIRERLERTSISPAQRELATARLNIRSQ